MTQPPTRSEPKTSVLGTLGWVGMVVVLSALALILLSWLGPLGEH